MISNIDKYAEVPLISTLSSQKNSCPHHSSVGASLPHVLGILCWLRVSETVPYSAQEEVPLLKVTDDLCQIDSYLETSYLILQQHTGDFPSTPHTLKPFSPPDFPWHCSLFLSPFWFPASSHFKTLQSALWLISLHSNNQSNTIYALDGPGILPLPSALLLNL